MLALALILLFIFVAAAMISLSIVVAGMGKVLMTISWIVVVFLIILFLSGVAGKKQP